MSDNQDSDEKNEYARVNRVMLSKKSEEYRQRRERNNAAVKKSRHKSKQKTLETQKRVEKLKSENISLERRLETLSREFALMRDIFVPRQDLVQAQRSDHQHHLDQLQLAHLENNAGLQPTGYAQRQILQVDSQQKQYAEDQQVTNVLNIQALSKIGN